MPKSLISNQSYKWIKKYAKAIQIIGIIYIAVSVMSMIIVVIESDSLGYKLTNFQDWRKFIVVGCQYTDSIGYGVVIIGLAKFLKYLFLKNEPLGWTLKHASLILYCWVAIKLVMVLNTVISNLFFIESLWEEVGPAMIAIGGAIVAVTFAMLPSLVLILIAIILRRVIAAFEESREIA